MELVSQLDSPQLVGRSNFVRNLGGGDDEPELSSRFALMDSAGIDIQVISPAAIVPDSADEESTVRASKFLNDEYADLVSRFPERFRAFATLPLPYVQSSLEELSRAIDTLDMVGVAALTSFAGKSLVDPEFAPLWEELDRRNGVIFFHPSGTAIGSRLISDYHVTWLIGAPIEDTVMAMHLIRYGIPIRYPNVKIIIAHAGGALPMVLQRLDDQPSPMDRSAGPEVLEPPSATARRMFYDTSVHRHVPALRCAVDSFGADRLLLGTDYPFNKGDRFTGCVSYVEQAGLDVEQKRNVLDTNASSLFNLQDSRV